jgi:hypothetical protein
MRAERARKGLLTMSRPKGIEEKLERFINAWATLAPDKTFGGMTLAQFKTVCAPSTEARAEIDELQNRMTQAIAKREAADESTAIKLELVVNGVRADPTEGPDSALYEALGYTPKSARKTGLTRKSKTPATKQG